VASPTPTPGPVSVRLVVDPPAAVNIDGKDLGTGRIPGGNFQLMPGRHTFTLTFPDYPDQIIVREVTATTKVVLLTLEVGMLTVMVDQTNAPPGGVAYLNGSEVGPVPLVRRKVPAGEYDLVVRWPGEDRVYRKRIMVPSLPAPPVVVPAVAPTSE
jgi:hypothetical protein